MSSLNPEAALPPGFRFHPTDEELVVHYLRRRAANQPLPAAIIAEVDIYKHDPWQLPEKAVFGDREWYFFTPRDRKYPNGIRPNRAAGSGYWKATGTDRPITSSSSPNGGGRGGVEIAVKKALVFYVGKPPKGTKTSWIMHEYRLAGQTGGHHRGVLHYVHSRTNGNKNQMAQLDPAGDTSPASANSMRLDDWVLCRIYKKSTTSNSSNSHGGAATSLDGTSDDGHNDVDDSNNNNNVVPDGAYYAAATASFPSSLPSLPYQGTGAAGDGMLPRPPSLSDLFSDVPDYAAFTRLLQDHNNHHGHQHQGPVPVLLGRPVDAEPAIARDHAASTSTPGEHNKRQRLLLEGAAYPAGFYNHVDGFSATTESLAPAYRNDDMSLNRGMMASFQVSSYGGGRGGVDQQVNNNLGGDFQQNGTAAVPLNPTTHHLGFR